MHPFFTVEYLKFPMAIMMPEITATMMILILAKDIPELSVNALKIVSTIPAAIIIIHT